MSGGRRFAPVIVILLAAASWTHPTAASDPIHSEVDAVFADYDTTTSPGCSLGVVRGGKMIYKRGYGMANLEYGIALSPRSVLRTGSVGKQFTAMAIALLAEQGVISLDDPLRKLFPEFPEYADGISIRHLVHHTSGLRDYLELSALTGLDDDARYSDEFAIELLARQKNLNFPPGDRYLYSNSGYFLMSHIVKRATGRTLREWAAENLFGPLGMEDSHYHDDHTHIVPNRADGYAPTEEGYRISMTTLDMVGDGGVFTTIEDFLAWDNNFYDNRLGRGGPDLIETVTTPGRFNNGQEMEYAFGLSVGEHRGLEIIDHGGSFVGFRAHTLRYPEQRFSVAVFCNRADADPGQRARQVATLYLADLMDPVTVPEKTASGEIVGVEVPVGRLERVAGHYWNERDRMAREVLLQEAKLFYVRSEENRSELVPLGEDRFVMLGMPVSVEVRFEPTDDGGSEMIITMEGEEPSVFRTFDKRALSDGELTAYAGTYYSEELDTDYVLETESGSLLFGFNRPGSHVLEPQFGDTFSNPDYGSFEFRRDADGDVIGFSLDSGRVRGLEFIRR